MAPYEMSSLVSVFTVIINSKSFVELYAAYWKVPTQIFGNR